MAYICLDVKQNGLNKLGTKDVQLSITNNYTLVPLILYEGLFRCIIHCIYLTN